MGEVKLISECFVKPKYEVEASKQPYHLSPIELGMLSIDPIQKGLLFSFDNLPSSNLIHDRTKLVFDLLDKLKHSLSIALLHFYPLAGRLHTQKYPDDHTCLIFVDCSKGPGARLIHVTTAPDVSISNILSSIDIPPIVRSFFELGQKMVGHDGHTKALLSIQVTQLLDGVFIGFTMNHSIVDGTTFTHFVSMLSEIFMSNNIATKISRPPIFDYKPWMKNYIIKDVAFLKLPYLEPEEFIEHGYDPGPLRERIFHFSSKSLAALKAKANQECGTQNVISTFQALSALVWRSITRARNLSSDQLTSCSILINARSRFDPPLPNNCFGNIISATNQCICSVNELLGQSLGWAAMHVHKSVMGQDAKAVVGFYKIFSDNPMVPQRDAGSEYHGPNKVVMGGSARFDMYGPEFGLGRAVAARMGYANKEDGKVTANPGCDVGGSIDLEICLRPQFMASLEIDSEFTNNMTLQ